MLAIRNVFQAGSSVLRTKAQPVQAIDEVIFALLEDMAETMYDAGGVGLAAPQVGIPKRLIVVDEGEGNLLRLINPVLDNAEGECAAVEGCLSVPGIMGEVTRAKKVVVSALDTEGKRITIQAENLLARILQHEMDHLEGILFTDRATRLVKPEEMEG